MISANTYYLTFYLKIHQKIIANNFVGDFFNFSLTLNLFQRKLRILIQIQNLYFLIKIITNLKRKKMCRVYSKITQKLVFNYFFREGAVLSVAAICVDALSCW